MAVAGAQVSVPQVQALAALAEVRGQKVRALVRLVLTVPVAEALAQQALA